MADSLSFAREPLPAGSRVACLVEYCGSRFNGWQSQPHPNTITVQDELERALSAVANSPVRVHCAGRTDTGVHASGQVIHFQAPATRPAKSWVLGTNASLPSDIRLHAAGAVPEDFHARFSAQWRSYRYIIANTPVRPAVLAPLVCWHRYPLDAELMHGEAQALLGERDFSAFRAAACQSSTPMRDVHSVSVTRNGEMVYIDIRANAFLHHMVRNIAGSLMAVGSGRQPQGWIAWLMEQGDRTQAADTADPGGLYLVAVGYPEQYDLPWAHTRVPLPA